MNIFSPEDEPLPFAKPDSNFYSAFTGAWGDQGDPGDPGLRPVTVALSL